MKNKIFVWLFVIVIGGFGLWNCFKSDEKYSMSERRKLEQMPELTWDNLRSGSFMDDFEDYTQDQFVGREAFRTVKAVSEIYGFQKLDNNDIYVVDGYASALEYPLNEDSLLNAAEKFSQIADKYLTENNQVYLSIIPDKNYFLAEENGYLSMDYEELFSIMQEQTSFMEYIDITNLLGLEDYYKTDTHWKQENLLDVAAFLAEYMNKDNSVQADKNILDDVNSNDFKEIVANEQFYGVYAGQSALPLQADALICLDSPLLQQCKVYDYQNQRECNVYDLELANGKDPYAVFLSGDISLLTIENPTGQTGKELIIFRDSFGSSIAPLLMKYYDKITLVDIRYLPSNQLDKYIEFQGQDVLFLYSTLVLNNSETLK